MLVSKKGGIMKTVNQPIDDSLAERKETTKKTWLEILERGVESFEDEQGGEDGV